MSAPEALLAFAVFMSFVAAMPTEEERRVMTRGDFAYAWLFRFLQNVCINIRAVSPTLGALPDRHANPPSTEKHNP